MTAIGDRPWPASILGASMALACAAGGLALAHQHPLAPWGAPLLFLGAIAAFGVWPAAWPLVLPALLPLGGLAPWTGWLTFEEWDLLVLAIACSGYARLALPLGSSRATSQPPPAGRGRAPLLAAVVITLYALATLWSMSRGVTDAGGFAFGLFQGYREPMNSVRLAKSLFAALLLLPLWLAVQRSDPARAARHLALGMVLGLVATSLGATWERLAFTDLLNFSTDYRTTSLFWEMHVGGAALDGMLSLGLPFLVRELFVEPSRARWLLLAAGLLVAAYASLTTFSRAVYLSVPLGVTLMFLLHSAQSARSAPHQGAPLGAAARRWGVNGLPAAALVAAFAWAASAIFPTSGYRGLIALLGASALLLALPSVLRGATPTRWLLGLMGGSLICAVAWPATLVLPKGAYLAYALAATFTLAMVFACARRPGLEGRQVQSLALGGYVAVLACTALVVRHWGGPAALRAAWPVLAMLPLLLLVSLARPSGLWPGRWRWQAGTAAAMLLAGGVVAAFGGGAYMSGRFSTSGSDLGDRMNFWRQGLSQLHGMQDLLFGRGLGRFVQSYAVAAPANQVPGDYRLRREGGNPFVTLVAGTHELGWGELLRLSQRIAAPRGPTFAQLDVRSQQAAEVHLEVCLKHLLYDGGCLVGKARLAAKPGQWQTAKVQLDGKELDTGAWYAPRLVMFSVASESAGVRVDIDNLALTGADGRNQLINGDFTAELSRWFMTSDRYHMPWHIKNIVAHVAFEQGLIGLALWAALVAGALWRLTLGSARAHPLAPGIAGGLAGFLTVGTFDSLLDVPRLAFLFYFLVLLGLTLRPSVSRSVAHPSV